MCKPAISLLIAFAMLIAFDVAAEEESTFVLSVHDLTHKAQKLDGRKVAVRGYLTSLKLYPTKEQALLGDFSFISVSDGDNGGVRQACSESYVEIIAHVSYPHPTDWALLPTEISKLSPTEKGPPLKEACWVREGEY